MDNLFNGNNAGITLILICRRWSVGEKDTCAEVNYWRIESLISSGSIKRILASVHIYFRDIGVNLQHRAWGVNHGAFINVNGISMANSPHWKFSPKRFEKWCWEASWSVSLFTLMLLTALSAFVWALRYCT